MHYLSQILQVPASLPLPKFKSSETIEQIRARYLNMLSAPLGEFGDVRLVALSGLHLSRETVDLIEFVVLNFLSPQTQEFRLSSRQEWGMDLVAKMKDHAEEAMCAVLHYRDRSLLTPSQFAQFHIVVGSRNTRLTCKQNASLASLMRQKTGK